MEVSGAAAAIARGVSGIIGPSWACLAVVLACAALTYGGVSLFVVGFSVYPIAVQLFREADLPRRFIPAAIAFGSITFTMTSAGSPEIQNLIPIKYLVDKTKGEPLTDARAGWPVSLIVATLMFVSGQAYLEWAIRRDQRRGERFEPRPTDPVVPAPTSTEEQLHIPVQQGPSLVASVAPLLVTLLALNLAPRLWSQFPEDPTLAIFSGVAAATLCLWRYLPSVLHPMGEGFVNGLLAIGSTCSVVGFGSALQDLPAFKQLVDGVTHLPGAADWSRGRGGGDRRHCRLGVGRTGTGAAADQAHLCGRTGRGAASFASRGRHRIGIARFVSGERLPGHAHSQYLRRDARASLWSDLHHDIDHPIDRNDGRHLAL